MARNYINWYNRRNNNVSLQERPSITNIVNGKKRYYSSLDAEIFLGDVFIDEVTNLVYSVQQQTLPVFGYNSYTFDDIIVGARMIQGQFSINYTKADLINTLNTTKRSRRILGDDYYIKSNFKGSKEKLTKPSWNYGFNIVIGFGDNSKTSSKIDNNLYKTYTVLDCCQIIGSSVQLDINGLPIQEIFSFVARDILYKNSTDKEDVSANENNKASIGTDIIKNYECNATINLKDDTAKISVEFKDKKEIIGGYIVLLDSFSDKTLTSIKQLAVENEMLTGYFDKRKTKVLKQEIDKNNLNELKAQLTFSYNSRNEDVKSEKTVVQKISIKINK